MDLPATFSPDGTRIACVSFGTKSHLEFGFGAASVSSTAEAIVRISKIKYKGEFSRDHMQTTL